MSAAEIEIAVPGTQLVVSFVRDNEVLDKFYCTDARMAWRLAAVILASVHPDLQAGDTLTVEARRRPNLIEAGLG